ncbi:MAG TPA: 50S ribosomal protein L11 methyltransferase [Solirubrobacterales bacterium]|nr:50S ribosomal protein L11 methyltransferase [Solirubrobacterales bacterium]
MIRLAVRARPEHADRMLAELLELAPGGVEEERGETYVEFAIYGAPGEFPALPELEAAAGEGMVEVSSAEIPDDWADRWRDFHGPVVVGGTVRVRPSWAEPEAGPDGGLVDVVIDPARAFGTGAHATTRLCLQLLLERAASGVDRGALADWGTGSGVLAIAAAKLGYSPVLACDHEAAAVDAAASNAAANGVEIELARLNLREQPPPIAPTVTANLTAPVLTAVARRLAGDGTGVPRTLICSGLLAAEVDEIASAFAPSGLRERARRGDGDWHALLLAS